METEMEAPSPAAGQSSSPDTTPTLSSPLTQTTHSLSSSISVPGSASVSVSSVSPEDQDEDHAHTYTYTPPAPAAGATPCETPGAATDPNNLDDIFGPPSPSPPASSPIHAHTYDQHRHIDPSDSPSLRSIHSTAGYRDGISAAREAAVQGGFDEGYLLGAALGLRVGVLRGVVRGLVQGLGTSQGLGAGAPKPNPEVVDRVQALAERMRCDLVLENVLGPAFVLPDGSWRWDVDEEDVAREGVHAVAEAHPLVRAYAGVVGRWVRVLGVRKMGERDGDVDGDGGGG